MEIRFLKKIDSETANSTLEVKTMSFHQDDCIKKIKKLVKKNAINNSSCQHDDCVSFNM